MPGAASKRLAEARARSGCKTIGRIVYGCGRQAYRAIDGDVRDHPVLGRSCSSRHQTMTSLACASDTHARTRVLPTYGKKPLALTMKVEHSPCAKSAHTVRILRGYGAPWR